MPYFQSLASHCFLQNRKHRVRNHIVRNVRSQHSAVTDSSQTLDHAGPRWNVREESSLFLDEKCRHASLYSPVETETAKVSVLVTLSHVELEEPSGEKLPSHGIARARCTTKGYEKCLRRSQPTHSTWDLNLLLNGHCSMTRTTKIQKLPPRVFPHES